MFVGPILLGFLVSYLLNSLFVYLEHKGFSRSISAYTCVILILLLIATLVWIILPILLTQLQTIVVSLPKILGLIDLYFSPKIKIIASYIDDSSTQNISIYNIFPFNFEGVLEVILTGFTSSTKFILSSLIFIVFTPVFMFIFMKYLSKLYLSINQLLPPSIKSFLLDFFSEIDTKLKTVLYGQLTVVLLLCILYPIAFLIAGLPTAIFVGIVVGAGRIISGLDTIIAIFLGSIVIIINECNYTIILSSILAFTCVQTLDNFLITPKIMGKFAGIHPLVIFLSIITLAYWFGVYGALLALPIIAILKVVLQKVFVAYKNSAFFNS